MIIQDSVRNSLLIGNNSNIINDNLFKKLLENCFAILTGGNEINNMNSLYNSKPDVIKEYYAALLSLTAQFVRNNQTQENVEDYLTNQLNYNRKKVEIYFDFYKRNRLSIEMSLINIGSHLPHVTDVNWKIDYIVKTNNSNLSTGPLFRISLLTEKFDDANDCKKLDYVNFSCDSQELQDLVYKLKDIVRHCQRITAE